MSIFTPRPRLNLVSASLFIAAAFLWILTNALFATLLFIVAVRFGPQTEGLVSVGLGALLIYALMGVLAPSILAALKQIWDMVGSIREELTDRQVNG
jgi:hypothetical protein